MKKCLSPEQLVLYCDKSLANDEREAVLEHLRVCRKCRKECGEVASLLSRLEFASSCPSINEISSFGYDESSQANRFLKNHINFCVDCGDLQKKLTLAEQAFLKSSCSSSERIPMRLLGALEELYPNRDKSFFKSFLDKLLRYSKVAACFLCALCCLFAFFFFGEDGFINVEKVKKIDSSAEINSRTFNSPVLSKANFKTNGGKLELSCDSPSPVSSAPALYGDVFSEDVSFSDFSEKNNFSLPYDEYLLPDLINSPLDVGTRFSISKDLDYLKPSDVFSISRRNSDVLEDYSYTYPLLNRTSFFLVSPVLSLAGSNSLIPEFYISPDLLRNIINDSLGSESVDVKYVKRPGMSGYAYKIVRRRIFTQKEEEYLRQICNKFRTIEFIIE